MKLNLGCGPEKRIGFCNVDIRPEVSPDIICDLSSFPWPFEDSIASSLLAKDIIEHFKLTQVPLFIRECARIAKPGGKIELRYPDFDRLIEGYQKGIDGLCEPGNLPFINLHLMGGQDYQENQHLCLLNQRIIEELLLAEGFSDIKSQISNAFNRTTTAIMGG